LLANFASDWLRARRSGRFAADEHFTLPHDSARLDLDNHEGFADQYARARDTGLDEMADEIIEISDDNSFRRAR
jgi:hypothetical protein